MLALALAVVSLSAGLSAAGGRMGGPAAAAVLAQLLLMPPLALALARAMAMPEAVTAGLVLLAAAPGAAQGQLLTALAGGDMPLARGIAALGTGLSVVTLPAMAGWLLPPAAGFQGAMLLLVLLPATAGMLLSRLAPALAARLSGPLATAASLATAALILAALWRGGPWPAALWSALALALLALGLARALAAGLRLREGAAVALMMALPLRNVAVPIALAFGAGRPDWALAGACYGIAMPVVALGFLALRLRRRA